MTLAENLARAASGALRLYVRKFPVQLGKKSAYRVIKRLTRGVGVELLSETSFGARFPCRLREVIQSRIYLFGVWEPQLTAFMMRRLRSGDVFLDVGANIGYYTILAAGRVGAAGKVVAVEASPRMFEILSGNLDRNKVENTRLLHAAAGDRSGTVSFYGGSSANSGIGTTRSDAGLPLEAEVSMLPFIELLQPDERARCRLVKIDVEGGEAPLLDNFLANVHSFPKDIEIVVEVSPIAFPGEKCQQIFDRFRAQGFFAYRIENDYDFRSYLAGPQSTPPRRIQKAPAAQTDVVFSRQDLDEL